MEKLLYFMNKIFFDKTKQSCYKKLMKKVYGRVVTVARVAIVKRKQKFQIGGALKILPYHRETSTNLDVIILIWDSLKNYE